ncbi:Capsule polysaccharide biosynthesis protein [Methanococcoides vulcani]|uniref:Capsule polysaccharide biosynthesis protein n=1 Tax=Methanococcoides vulcani TaxID=1353158 RepID=A0A1I0AQ82_9EURY|nr:hypothetical protein [Methanococcoides vulcani]SES95923.1 Capsule polysaccharide biosynthesis protein [Methanococcoides vulcani]
MKILIYMPFADWVPHLATDLEIAAKHMNDDDEVHIIQCSGDLPSCEPNPNHLKLRCILCRSRRNKGLDIINMPKQNRHELSLDSFMRDMNLPDFSSMQELKGFKIDNVDIGMAVASTLISMVREPDPDIDQYKSFINKNLLMSIAVYDAIKYNLEEIKPDIFYLFNGRFAPLRPALRAAQDLGIKTFVHERAGVLEKYSLTEDSYPHDIEYQKGQIEEYWNNEFSDTEKDEIATRWFEERRGGKDQSWFSFTKSQIKGNLPEGFDLSKRNIAIFISSQDEFEAISGWQNLIYKNQTDAIDDIINAALDDDIIFHLRIHPNLRGLKNTQTQELSELKAPNLNVIPADSKIDSYQLMDACEKIITFGSTMGIESVFWGKPSILVGRALYEGVEGCHIPKDRNELIDLINQHLDPANKTGALKYAHWQAVNGHPYIYYSPETVRGGKFMGEYLKNPISEKIKAKILSVNWLSQFIFNSAYLIRKMTWKVRQRF